MFISFIVLVGKSLPSGVVATQSQIGVFDLASSDVIIMESGLRDILENDKITKVPSFSLPFLPLSIPQEHLNIVTARFSQV